MLLAFQFASVKTPTVARLRKQLSSIAHHIASMLLSLPSGHIPLARQTCPELAAWHLLPGANPLFPCCMRRNSPLSGCMVRCAKAANRHSLERGRMDYRKYGTEYYIRLDRGDELVSSVLGVCEREGVRSATFSGIGGCSDAEIQVFNPAAGSFETERVEGLLELVNVTGNVITGAEGLSYHAHALFAYHEGDVQRIAAGHLKSTTVLYTAELELRPVEGGVIGAARDAETGTSFWCFEGTGAGEGERGPAQAASGEGA